MIMKRPRLLAFYVLSLSLLAACGGGGSLHFVSSLSEIRVERGNNAALQCIMDGDSSHGGSFTWTGPAVGSSRASISLDGSGTVSTLVISSVNLTDEGQYGCSYTGLEAIFMTLNVIYDPYFLPDVVLNQEFIVGTDAVVECPADFGDPEGYMVWTRNDLLLSKNGRFCPENGRLTIQNIQRDDAATYRCSLNHLGIHDSRYITVAVLERSELAPTIVEPMNPIEVMYRDPLDLLCQLEEPRNNVHYTWTVDTDFEDSHIANTTSALHRDAEQFLGGRYTCKAENEYGYDEQVFFVKILARPEPEFCAEADQTRKEGDTVVLEHCKITSPVQLRNLSFQWSKRRENEELEEIIPGRRFGVNHNGLLTIENVRQADSGQYQINISNSQGSALHTVRLQVTPGPQNPTATLRLRFELSESEDSDGSCQDIQEMKDSFTDELLIAICDELETCSEGSDIGLRDSTITCSNPDSKIGTFSAIIDGSNAATTVEDIQRFSDNLAVDLGSGLSVSLSVCDDDCPTVSVKPVRQVQNSGLVAGVVISVIFLVAMVIAAAILLTVIVFKYRKPTNRVTDTDQLERGENPIPPSQTQPQTQTTIDLSMVAPNLGAMTTDPADITAQGGNNQTQLPDTHQNLTLQASSNRPVRPSDLCIPGQNGSVATQKRMPLYNRSVSLDLPPRQQTFAQSSYA